MQSGTILCTWSSIQKSVYESPCLYSPPLLTQLRPSFTLSLSVAATIEISFEFFKVK